jgi:fatty-acyl-CoA synthase
MPIKVAERTPNAYAYPLLIKHLLHSPLATAPNQEIVYRDRSRYTYLTLRARISQLAAGLANLGVEAGTTVAVMDWDSHRYLECFFAIPMMGAVLQTVNVRLSPDQIAYTLKHAAAEVILVHRDFIPVLTGMLDQLPALRVVILIDDSPRGEEDSPAWLDIEYEQLLEGSSGYFAFEDFDENAVATTFYTTGTTGDPKGVCFSHRQIVLHTLAVLGACASPANGQSFRHGDVYMPMTPMFHVHAWGNPYVATVLGVKQVYPGRYVPDELLELRARESVTFSHCVPTVLQMLLTAAAASGANLRGWKICIGGAALSAGLAQEALNNGIDVYAGYGMSETGPVLTISRLLDPPGHLSAGIELERRCRAGLPIPLVDIKLLDADQMPVRHDGRGVGEIVVRAPWLTPCYVGNPQASEDLWRGGYLHTQDVARMDQLGFIQITDRIKDVIKSGGEWLSSLQLENLISLHPAVAEVAVVSVPDARWGERPHAFIVLRAEFRETLIAEDIRAHVAAAAARGSVPRYAIPERITLVDALERTSVGKINKRLLRERYP